MGAHFGDTSDVDVNSLGIELPRRSLLAAMNDERLLCEEFPNIHWLQCVMPVFFGETSADTLAVTTHLSHPA